MKNEKDFPNGTEDGRVVKGKEKGKAKLHFKFGLNLTGLDWIGIVPY